MKKFYKSILATVFAAAMVLGLGACSVVNTAPDAVALHYSGGAFTSQKFVECVPASTRKMNGPGEHYYYYPVGQRTFSFTGKENGGETDPIPTNTLDSQQVTVSGFVTFELNVEMIEGENGKMDCPALRQFHESIGYKNKVYFEGNPDMGLASIEGSEKDRHMADSAEWRAFLNDYLQTPLDAVMDDNGQLYGWNDLYRNQDVQSQFREGVKKDLPVAVNEALGSSEFFNVLNVTMSTPLPPQELLDALKGTEVAKEENNAQLERNKVARTKYQSMTECKAEGLTEETCVTLKIVEEGDIPFYILPDSDTSVIVQGS